MEYFNTLVKNANIQRMLGCQTVLKQKHAQVIIEYAWIKSLNFN